MNEWCLWSEARVLSGLVTCLLIGYIFSYMVYSHGHGIVMVIERLWFYMVI